MKTLVSVPPAADSPSLQRPSTSAPSPEQPYPHMFAQFAPLSPEEQDFANYVLRLPKTKPYFSHVLQRLFTDRQNLGAYTNTEWSVFINRCETQVKEMRRFFRKHALLSVIASLNEEGRNSAPCNASTSTNNKSLKEVLPPTPVVPFLKEINVPSNTSHGAEFHLCVDKLREIGFGVITPEGMEFAVRGFSRENFIERFGARNVLHAYEMTCRNPSYQNPAASLWSILRDRGIEAPEEWEFSDPPMLPRRPRQAGKPYPEEEEEPEEKWVPEEKDFQIAELQTLEEKLVLAGETRDGLRIEALDKTSLNDCSEEELERYRAKLLKRLVERIDDRPLEVFRDTPPELSAVYDWLRKRPDTVHCWWDLFQPSAMQYGADGSVVLWVRDLEQKALIETEFNKLIRDGLRRQREIVDGPALWTHWDYWEDDVRPEPVPRLRVEALDVIKLYDQPRHRLPATSWENKSCGSTRRLCSARDFQARGPRGAESRASAPNGAAPEAALNPLA